MKNIEKCPECGWTYKKESFIDDGWNYVKHVCSNPNCSFVFNVLTCSCGRFIGARHSLYPVGVSLRCRYCDKDIPFRIKSELFKNRNMKKKESKMAENTENDIRCSECNEKMMLYKDAKNSEYNSYFCPNQKCDRFGWKIKTKYKKELQKMEEDKLTKVAWNYIVQDSNSHMLSKENFVTILKNVIELDKKSRKLIELGFDTDSEVIQSMELSTDAICDILCNLYDIDIEFFVEWFLSDKKKASKRSGKTKYILLDTPEQFYDFAITNKPTLMEYGVI